MRDQEEEMLAITKMAIFYLAKWIFAFPLWGSKS